MSKIKFNLIRQKSDNYKKKQPEALSKVIHNAAGEKVQVADFEIFKEDYKFNIPILMYSVDNPHVLEPDMPFIALDGELWGVKGFIHVSETEININCVYCGITRALPIVNPSEAMDVVE